MEKIKNINDYYFEKNLDKYIKVSVPSDILHDIRHYASEMQCLKKQEYNVFGDTYGISARWFVGLIGEWAVSKVLHDWGLTDNNFSFHFVLGSSSSYNHPDFLELGYVLGCKTAVRGRCAKVKLNPKSGEVVCVYDKSDSSLYICGILTGDIARKYGDLDLIEDVELKAVSAARGTKVGFNRFDKLIPFTRETVGLYKSELEVEYRTTMTKEQYMGLYADCTFVEHFGDSIVFKRSRKGVITSTEIKKSELTGKTLNSVLDPYSTYLCVDGRDIFKEFQEVYAGFPISLTVYCLRDIFEGLKVKGYDCISRMAPADSLIRDLYMVYCPTIPNTIRSDSVSVDFYTMLWVLNSHLNVIDSPQD